MTTTSRRPIRRSRATRTSPTPPWSPPRRRRRSRRPKRPRKKRPRPPRPPPSRPPRRRPRNPRRRPRRPPPRPPRRRPLPRPRRPNSARSYAQLRGGKVVTADGLVAGRYRLGDKIGSGAMGIVWQAHDERLHRTVAVKQLLLQPGLSHAQAEEARRRCMREGRIAARLAHQNAITVYDVAEHDGDPWLVMEYLPSKS